MACFWTYLARPKHPVGRPKNQCSTVMHRPMDLTLKMIDRSTKSKSIE